jgi:hypothetical protein
LAALLVALTATGCLKETRKVDVATPGVVRHASLDELTATIDRFERVQSLKAVVDLQLTYLNDERNKETTLTDVRGGIVAERPDSIRVQAQLPVTRQKAFDMVSHSGMFKVYLAFKNRFFEGSTDTDTHSEKRSENIRPQHVLEPLLVAPFKENSILALDMVREGRALFYVVQEMIPEGGPYRIARKFWFSRSDLALSRLEIRGDDGEVETMASYEGWTDYGEKIFPTVTTIERPVDGYTLKITFLKPGIDEKPAENAFNLEPPDGVQVERIEEVRGAVAKKSGAE